MRTLVSICALALLSACGQPKTAPSDQQADIQFDESRFRQDIKTLSSDAFEGRAPGTQGEKLTLDYLSHAFSEMGLVKPNGIDYLQAVPMVSYTASAQTVSLAGMTLDSPKDTVFISRHEGKIDIKDAPLVFVGYGIDAPEYGWNDYKDLDMKGKIAVILVNDPGFANPNSGKFNGKTMTYYGRWTYKYEEASRQGALGAIIIHDTKPASYGWSVIENGRTGPQKDLVQSKEAQAQRIMVEGWMTFDTAMALFEKSGLSLKDLSEKAANKATNVPLQQTASIAFENKADYANSYNVVATLPGTTHADEHILFTAHWDHLGQYETDEGLKIYNGALDNATGTAGILEIARQFSAQALLGNGLSRSVTFVATTAEEQGLLGSRYYASHPLYELDKTVAVFNLDSTNVYGKTKDYTIVGKGKSELENYLIDAVSAQGRTPTSESRPEAGAFFRSDHFSFAKKGIPAVYAGRGNEPLDEATASYRKQMLEKMKGCYHNTCDEYHEDWDLSGSLQDMAVYYQAATTLANSQDWPGYFKGTEFHALRPATTEPK